MFESTTPGWPRVQAICDFVHNHIKFDYQHARATRTAHEAFNEGRGVCRDYAHLAIAFCRCLNIPARYCTGYLGDIGVPVSADPMDFSAWFEVFLGGRWYTFDARNNIPRIGRVLIARGRDASDVAISSTFGPNTLAGFTVWTDEVDSPQASSAAALRR
jgi:transglutaminase-like putative cysteine protease